MKKKWTKKKSIQNLELELELERIPELSIQDNSGKETYDEVNKQILEKKF